MNEITQRSRATPQFAEWPFEKNQTMVVGSTDGQSASGHREEENNTGEKHIDDRKGHASGEVRFSGKKLHPVALGRVIFSVDPSAGGRDLQR
jgi:hypothetical protein